MKRIAIIGGSFNPPHQGHIQVADIAMQEGQFDEVWMWVSRNVFKDPSVYAPVNDRTEMTKMLAGDRNWLKVIDTEKDFGDTMTATSMTMLQALYPHNRFTWVLGADNFSTFHTWDREKFEVDGAIIPDWQYIVDHFSILVIDRIDYTQAAKEGVAAKQLSGYFRQDPTILGHQSGWSFIRGPGVTLSSTSIKSQLLAGNTGIDGLTQELEAYIHQKGFYTGRAAFNGASRPTAQNNDVNFSVFILPANMANFIKALGKQNNTYDTEARLRQAASSWDDGFINPDTTEAEKKARHNALGTALTQGSIENCIQHLSQICATQGLEKHRLLNLLGLVLKDPTIDNPRAAFTKTLAALKDCAHETGVNWNTIQKETPNHFMEGPQA